MKVSERIAKWNWRLIQAALTTIAVLATAGATIFIAKAYYSQIDVMQKTLESLKESSRVSNHDDSAALRGLNMHFS